MRSGEQLARRSVPSPRRRRTSSTVRCTAREQAVLRMLDEIGSIRNVNAYIEKVSAEHHVSTAQPGFLRCTGSYKNYDPRAEIIKRIADQVFEVTGRNAKLDIAHELEKIAHNDEFFVKRKLYPNVDFYSGIIYQAMCFARTCSRCCSPFRERRGGWRNGRRCSRIRSRRSPARGRFTRAARQACLCRSRNGRLQRSGLHGLGTAFESQQARMDVSAFIPAWAMMIPMSSADWVAASTPASLARCSRSRL